MENFFQDTLQFPGFFPVDHGVFYSHMQQVRPWKCTFCFPKNGIFDNAVIFQFHQQAVPVNLQKLFRCILLRQTEPFKDSDLDLFSRKKLLSNSPFQIPDVLFMN